MKGSNTLIWLVISFILVCTAPYSTLLVADRAQLESCQGGYQTLIGMYAYVYDHTEDRIGTELVSNFVVFMSVIFSV